MEPDHYAAGMIHSGEDHFDLTPELDAFQYRMIKPHLGKCILEVGAGAGRITELILKEKITPDHYTVSEPSTHFIQQLQKRIKQTDRIEFFQGETSDILKKYPNAFDSIFSVHVLEHVQDDWQFIEDCFRMLKPGGKLIVLVPALQFLYSNLDRNIGHYRRYDKKMVRTLIKEFDCIVEKIYYTNFLAIFPSLIFLKLGKLDYQKSSSDKKQFIFLYRIYSKYLVPFMDFMERFVPIPIGLNLTFVLRKPNN